ncbi:methionine permease [Thecaphora frezii]
MTTPALPHGTAKPSSYSASQKSIDNVRDANVKVGANYDEENRDLDSDDGSDHLPQGRQLGLVSAIFLIVNRIVGTGIFATTSTILDQSGSVGMSLIYWLIGAVIAMTGYLTFAELGSAMPKNGAELNYLQYMYRRPKYLVATMYAAQAFLLGGAAGNSYVAGRYLLSAGGVTSEWGSRGIGAGILITVLIVHGTLLKWGLRFQNIVGLLKLVVLVIIAFSGFAALAGHTKVQPPPSNFKNVFAGSRSDVYGTVSCLYNAVWSYVGFTNIFYAMSEIKRPIRTMKIAGPAAIVVITVLYMLVQVAYFAAVPREEILGSTQVIAALYFRNMFGHSSERALSVLVALSATANVFSVVFSNGRLVQAMGRDSLIPLPKLFASNRPFKAPLAGIAWHTLMTLIILLAPPAGDAYNFVLNLASYPINVVNAAVSLGLLSAYLPARLRPSWARDWSPPLRASWPVVLFFTLVSFFLVVAPWVPPKKASDSVYNSLWYAMAPAVGLGIFLIGAVYWLVRFIVIPKYGGYRLEEEHSVLSDGTPVRRLIKVAL